MLSSALPPAVLLPSGLPLSLEEAEAVAKREERQPVETAVSKIITSVVRCSHAPHAAPMLLKHKPIIPGGNTAKLTRSPQADPLTRYGIKSLTPAVRDKMHHASYPNGVSPGHISSFQQSNLKADSSNRHIAVSTLAKNKRRVSSPGAKTAPALLSSTPVHPLWAHSCSLSPREGTRQNVSDVTNSHQIADLPVPRKAILSQPHAPCIELCPQTSAWSQDELLAVRVLRHPNDVVSRVDKTSSSYSLVLHETVPPQPCWPKIRERPFECPETPPERHDRAQVITPPETAASAKWDNVGDVSSCENSSNGLRYRPYPLVPPALPDPWALPPDSIHLPDMLREVKAVSEHLDMGCLDSPQAGLEAAIKQPPESWLIDTVVALTRAHLAGRAASEEFRPRVLKLLPDELSMVEQ
jgi:hypothetical protein